MIGNNDTNVKSADLFIRITLDPGRRIDVFAQLVLMEEELISYA
jgi:hypothetical protein